MYTGEVLNFSGAKGWGFLSNDDGGSDIFVHWSAIVGQEGYKTLDRGDRCSYEIETGPKGKPQAANVRVQGKAVV